MYGQYWKRDRTMSTNEWLLTSDFWQFLEPWHGRWYEYEIFVASGTDNIYDLENERWLLGDMIDHVGIYGSRVAEGLSAFSVGLFPIVGGCTMIVFPLFYIHTGKAAFFHLHCAVYGVRKQSRTLWPEGHIHVFAHTLPLLLYLVILIMQTYWRH